MFRLDEKYIPEPAKLMAAMVRVSPDLNFARDSRPAMVYRIQISSDRELMQKLLSLVRKLIGELERDAA